RRPKDIAVLYRSNGQSKLIEEALREHSIPHRVVGGQTFFERKEVKDILSYLKVAVNPAHAISLRRIINYPARGLADTTVERLARRQQARHRRGLGRTEHGGAPLGQCREPLSHLLEARRAPGERRRRWPDQGRLRVVPPCADARLWRRRRGAEGRGDPLDAPW